MVLRQQQELLKKLISQQKQVCVFPESNMMIFTLFMGKTMGRKRRGVQAEYDLIVDSQLVALIS